LLDLDLGLIPACHTHLAQPQTRTASSTLPIQFITIGLIFFAESRLYPDATCVTLSSGRFLFSPLIGCFIGSDGLELGGTPQLQAGALPGLDEPPQHPEEQPVRTKVRTKMAARPIS